MKFEWAVTPDEKEEEMRSLRTEAYYQGVTFSKINPYYLISRDKKEMERKVDNTCTVAITRIHSDI